MKVFKFGGASVKDVSGVKNVAIILQLHLDNPVVVVISAMGKTTNALENILNLYRDQHDHTGPLTSLKQFHASIMAELFLSNHAVFGLVDGLFKDLEMQFNNHKTYDEVYDQVVSYGELLSTTIIYYYLLGQGLPCDWVDAREYVFTDNNYREGKINWPKTCSAMKALNHIFKRKNFVITQGFIGKAENGSTTTLGRDGSDFSAAIFAACLKAESVTIWKDVVGVMNADPKRIPTATVFDELPFREAAEMTYYGATVIHPKTIKPLATQSIPLFVKSFDNPALPGTKIHECHIKQLPPLIVFKDNQCLISCRVTDYTFITEIHLSKIFTLLADLNIQINVMQNSAISFSFCIDFRETKLKALISHLQPDFEVYYNTGLTLITVKNYDEETFDLYRRKSGILLQQTSRSTLQILIQL